MKMMLTPSAFRSAMTRISRSVSASVRLEVGSSMMTSRAFSDSALAISTSCICASDSSATGVSAAEIHAQPVEDRRAPRMQRRAVDQPQRAAAQRLAADEDIGGHIEIVEQVEFLVNEGDAGADRIGDGQRGTRSRRRGGCCPDVGAMTPPRIFIRVDLPAPFSPTGR